MKFSGLITNVMPIATGTSKSGKEWKRQECVLLYDNSNADYPKCVVFSVMGDNISKFGIAVNHQYELDIDFSVREYNGKYFMSGTCWRAMELDRPTSVPTVSATPQQSQPAMAVAPETVSGGDIIDSLPF
jgi:hypothetical protein